MKYIICSDNHFCTSSSVITKRGERYSSRLENQVKSLEWVNSFNIPVIHLGDFFDREVLTAEEISCLKDVKEKVDFSRWTFLQGNHGYSGGFDVMGVFDGQVITKPTVTYLDGLKVLYLPFRFELSEITGDFDIIFGHIGVEGIPFGAKGIDPDWIQSHCKLFMNGHLHNRKEFAKNCFNIGSLTAQNFSDDCYEAEKGIWILDTESGLMPTFVENPFAFNFYKFSLKDARQYNILHLETACISVTCKESDAEEVRKKFEKAYYLRINIQKDKVKNSSSDVTDKTGTVDYLGKFKISFVEKVGTSPIIEEELSEVCQ